MLEKYIDRWCTDEDTNCGVLGGFARDCPAKVLEGPDLGYGRDQPEEGEQELAGQTGGMFGLIGQGKERTRERSTIRVCASVVV
jgi:hypothetical protein